MIVTDSNTAMINQALDLIQSLKETRGIKQKGGKLYTVVADRIEAFRRVTGDFYGIETTLDHYNPENPEAPVVVRAVIRRLSDGSIVATGHAEEWRSASYVNKTSAIENAETSAVGRALAALGLHGGEYASANEIDVAHAKQAHIEKKAEPKTEAKTQVNIPVQDAVATVEIKEKLFVEIVREFLPECKTVKDLTGFWTTNSGIITDLKSEDPAAFGAIKDMFAARKAELSKETKQ